MTKHFGAENGYSTCVVSDNAAHYASVPGADIEINDYCDDAVCEICCFIMTNASGDGRKTALIYNDTHRGAERVERKQFDTDGSFDAFLPYYAACTATEPVGAAAMLGCAEDGTDNDLIFVTSRLTADSVADLCGARSVSRAVTVVLFEPYSMLNDPEKIKNETEAYINELASADVNVQRISETELL